MPAEGAAIIRPRTTGELLDDAWRLYLADAPALLLMSSLFLAPAFAALLLLTGLPTPTNVALGLLAPLAPPALLVLTGLGSGACQEWLRARAEGRTPSPRGCLAAAFRRGLAHAAARSLALVGPLLGLGVWLSIVPATVKPGGSADGGQLLWRLLLTAVACLPGLLVWPLLATLHAFLASGKARSQADLGRHFRLAGSETGKGGVLTLTRVALLMLAVVNLHLLVGVGLWVLDGLAGLDAALAATQLAIANPVYDLALVLLAWMLLAPFFETCNFLLYVDARSRHEGLDLQVRVQNVFPTGERKRVAALAVLVGFLWLAAAPARAETVVDAVHAARLDVERIAPKAGAEEPYQSRPWQDELNKTADRLEQAGGRDRFAWFRKAVNDFASLQKDKALQVLSALDDRLALLEETLAPGQGNEPAPPNDDFKKRLQQSGGARPAVQPEEDTDRKKADDQKKADDDQKKADDENGQSSHSVGVGPGSVPGCGQVGLMLTAGLALAVLIVGAVMFIAWRKKEAPTAKRPAVPARSVRQTEERREPLPIERPVAELWREADDLARQEQYREAVRRLYLGVLSLLHRQQLLRFEAMRTNGEYIQQVRLAPQAPPALHAVFQEFTNFFESKWYGDPACDGAEYRAARKLAEEVQALAREV